MMGARGTGQIRTSEADKTRNGQISFKKKNHRKKEYEIRGWKQSVEYYYRLITKGSNSRAYGGAIPKTNEIVTLICSCHNFFFPFFCANTFYTSLLLIVCALR